MNIHLEQIISIGLSKNLYFALYQLPGESESELIIQTNNKLQKYNSVEYISDTSGFIVSPFVHSLHNKTYVINPDIFKKGSEINHHIIQQVLSIPTAKHSENSFPKPKGEFNKEEYVA